MIFTGRRRWLPRGPGSRDFDTIADYRAFIDALVGRRSARSRKRIAAERAVLRARCRRAVSRTGEQAMVTVTG